MANEAVIIELLGENKGEPIRFTINEGFAAQKGDIMALIEPRTVSGALQTAGADVFAGIASAEKVVGDGATTLACYTKGIFDLKMAAGSTCSAGARLVISGANQVADGGTPRAGTPATASKVGIALEDASDAEVIAVAVGVY